MTTWNRVPTSYVLIGLSVTGIVLIGITTITKMQTKLVWNASPSTATGLYWVENRLARPGALVLVWFPKPVRNYVVHRGILPRNTPALKWIAAAHGDIVCRTQSLVLINGRQVAVAKYRDAEKRLLPIWQGCQKLAKKEVFLLSDHPGSFDGRYFGVTDRSDILGVAKPLLVW